MSTKPFFLNTIVPNFPNFYFVAKEGHRNSGAKIIPPNRFPPGSFDDAFKRRGEVLNHGGVYADTALWRKHEEKWEHFSEYARGQSIIRPWDVPWPESGVQVPAPVGSGKIFLP